MENRKFYHHPAPFHKAYIRRTKQKKKKGNPWVHNAEVRKHLENFKLGMVLISKTGKPQLAPLT